MKQVVLFAIALTISTPAWAQRPVQSRDLLRIREVSDPQLSPDGAWVAYTVTTSDTAADKRDSDVWMSRWDGKRSVRLTYSKAREHSPRWSPDGRYLAFLSSREDPREVAQIWLLDRTGGEAERVTDFPGGVSDYAWAPDGSSFASLGQDRVVVVWDAATLAPRSVLTGHAAAARSVSG